MSSERTAQRLSRILAVLPWIISRNGANMDDLVARFHYKDKADLVKDLHLVFMTGLPGYGPGDLIDVDIFADEVHIDAADYFARPIRLTAPEALGLLAAGMTFIQSDQAPSALVSAVRKLTAVVLPDAESYVHFDVPTPELVRRLQEVIERRHTMRITYVALASNTRTVRSVEGRSVFFNLGNWYLAGHCHLANAERVFRVDRIAEVEELDDAYELPEPPSDAIVRYRPDDGDAHVTFTTNPASSWVAEYYPVDTRDLDDGSQRVTMSVSDPLVAARLLIGLGNAVSDIEGEEVVAAIRDLRARISRRYAPAK
ncbi:MAG: WYL domain-containing protein [Actinomycetota bacterium]|nr:WYL domain-containing protein [Actinomycetota bacterium]